jgi:hypothetical protein
MKMFDLPMVLGYELKCIRFSVKLQQNEAVWNPHCEPGQQDIMEAVLDGLSFVIRTVEYVPRLEEVIFSPVAKDILLGETNPESSSDSIRNLASLLNSVSSSVSGIKLTVEDSKLNEAKSFVAASLAGTFKLIQQVIDGYEDYKYIFDPKTEKQIETFFSEDHSFEDYTKVN